MSLACFLSVSSESLPLLMRLPRSLCLALSTISGRPLLRSRTAPPIACDSTSATTPMTSTITSTSRVEHSFRLQPDRRSIAVTTGERTATLRTETRITRMTFVIDASAHAIAAAAVTSRIVRTDTETSTFVRSSPAEDDPAAVIWALHTERGGWLRPACPDAVTENARRSHHIRPERVASCLRP
jgi:hypothetical protein